MTWPMPDAAVSNDGEDVVGWMERRERVRESCGNGNGFGVPLAMAARLWPTPSASDVMGSRTLPPGTSPTGVRPDGKKAQVGLENAARMWPTPTANDRLDAGYQRSGGRAFPTLPGAVGGAKPPPSGPWPTRPVEPWERDVPRTIDPKASPNRRPRLRALGNAVVPQVGEVVGRVLLDIDAAMRDEVSHD